MNDQIKQLAEEVEACYIPRYDMWQMDTESLEKFSELIVRECITKVSEWDMGVDYPVGATDNISQVARDMVAEIKEHFGFKE